MLVVYGSSISSETLYVGCWVGERAALGAGSALRGEDQKSQHWFDHLSSRISHHTHDSVTHLDTVTHIHPIHRFSVYTSIYCSQFNESGMFT